VRAGLRSELEGAEALKSSLELAGPGPGGIETDDGPMPVRISLPAVARRSSSADSVRPGPVVTTTDVVPGGTVLVVHH
jgi:hypothetical protein